MYEILKMNLRKEGKLDERTQSLKESRMKSETRFCVMHSIILNITWLTDIKFQESYINYKYNDCGYTQLWLSNVYFTFFYKNSLFLHYCQTYVSDKNTKVSLKGKRFILSHDFRYFSHGSHAPWYCAENKTESNDKKQKIFLPSSRWGKERNRTRQSLQSLLPLSYLQLDPTLEVSITSK